MIATSVKTIETLIFSMIDMILSKGDLFTGIGTIGLAIAAWKGINEFSKARKLKKSDAAALILAKFRHCIYEIGLIVRKRQLYQFRCYPKEISEGTEDEKKAYPERPTRLIEAILLDLRRELHEPSTQLSLRLFADLFNIIEEVEKYSTSLGQSIYLSLKIDNAGPQGALAEKEQFTEFYQNILYAYGLDLKKFTSQTEELLIPIIEHGEKLQ